MEKRNSSPPETQFPRLKLPEEWNIQTKTVQEHTETSEHRQRNTGRQAAGKQQRPGSQRNRSGSRTQTAGTRSSSRKQTGSRGQTAQKRSTPRGQRRQDSSRRPTGKRPSSSARRKAQVKRQRLFLITGILAVLLAVILICTSVIRSNKRKAQQAAALQKKQEAQQAAEEAAALEKENTLTLLAVGDNLYHDRIISSGKKNNWNFDFLYENVKDEIQAADLAIANQETVYVANHDDATGYPIFGTPEEAGDAEVNAGFDVILHASNHAFDLGEDGILNTLKFWREKHPDIYALGIHDSQADADTVQVAEIKNFKIAMINMCYGLNIENYNTETEYMVDILSQARIKALVAKAKKEGNLTVFFLHAGTEGSEAPDEDVQKWVQLLVEEGVDIIIGSHPHILQGYEMLENEEGHQTLVYYSMGNFLSTQETLDGLLGGIAKITVKRDPVTHEVTVEDYTLEPTVMHYNEQKDVYKVYYLDDYTEELAKDHDIHQYSDEEFTVSSLKKRFQELSVSVPAKQEDTGSQTAAGSDGIDGTDSQDYSAEQETDYGSSDLSEDWSASQDLSSSYE